MLRFTIRRHFASTTSTSTSHHDVVIIGAGSGGLSVASQLYRHHSPLKVALIDPSPVHYYQPLWTLVGGGLKSLASSRRPMSDVIDRAFAAGAVGKDVHWLQTQVTRVDAQAKRVELADGRSVEYKCLVVASGVAVRDDLIPGLTVALADPSAPVATNYLPTTVEKTARLMREFKGGRALFTQPSTPIKCGGAPQKIMYLCDEHWAANGVKRQVEFHTGSGKLFPVDKYSKALQSVCDRRGIQVNLQSELVGIDGQARVATFKQPTGSTIQREFSFAHVTPPMTPHAYIQESGLSDQAGFVQVDHRTLQHVKYGDVFSLGDAAGLPVSKTASAVAAQTHVVAQNLLAALQDRPLTSQYDGYTSCPLVTSSKSLIMAEFDGFSLQPRETFALNQAKERLSMYLVKSEVLPPLYWLGMLRGRWNGPGAWRRLLNPLGWN